MPPYRPSALEVLNAPEAFDPDRPEQVAAVYFRSEGGMSLPEARPIDADGVWFYHIDRAVDHIRNGMDFIIVITGKTGRGKSTVAITFCDRLRNALNAELGLHEVFDPEQDVIYRLSDLIYRIFQSSGENPLVLLADEGVTVGAQAQAGASPEGLILEQTLSICRVKRATVCFLNPTFEGTASSIRKRRAEYWIHVEEKGRATSFHATDALPKDVLRDSRFLKDRQPFNSIEFDSLEGDTIWERYTDKMLVAKNRVLLDLALRAVALEFARGLRIPEWAFPLLEERQPEWFVREMKHAGGADHPFKHGKGPLPPPPQKLPCRFRCGKKLLWYNREQHEASCAKRPKGK
jgi:hypothetical protein